MQGKRQTSGHNSATPIRKALRITCTYAGQGIKLESVEQIEMTVPPTDGLEYSANESGFWVELRDNSDKAFYRRIIDNPIRRTIEVRTDNPNEPFEWHDIDQPEGRFTFLLPDTSEARNLVLFSSPSTKGEELTVAAEIARFDVTSKLHEREK
jgi:hypothetical protein